MIRFFVEFNFFNVLPDCVFKIMQVDQLYVELVVKMFDLYQLIAVGFSCSPFVKLGFNPLIPST
ncbi:MAG: hypothetical protein IPL50_21110 [Chitinophagaceae bacterium]|nr:hypothetical protein [Chitinophagaceae bacterium]